MALNIGDPETDRLDTVYSDLIAIGERGRSRPRLDERAEDEILGYDASGIPS